MTKNRSDEPGAIIRRPAHIGQTCHPRLSSPNGIAGFGSGLPADRAHDGADAQARQGLVRANRAGRPGPCCPGTCGYTRPFATAAALTLTGSGSVSVASNPLGARRRRTKSRSDAVAFTIPAMSSTKTPAQIKANYVALMRVSLAVADLPHDSAATTVAFSDASQFLTGFAGNTRSYK